MIIEFTLAEARALLYAAGHMYDDYSESPAKCGITTREANNYFRAHNKLVTGIEHVERRKRTRLNQISDLRG